jgi:hypothetical protein
MESSRTSSLGECGGDFMPRSRLASPDVLRHLGLCRRGSRAVAFRGASRNRAPRGGAIHFIWAQLEVGDGLVPAEAVVAPGR